MSPPVLGTRAKTPIVIDFFHDTMQAANKGELTSLSLTPPAYLTREAPYWGASDVASCPRRLAYKAKSDPISLAGYNQWVAGLGTLVHAAIQHAAKEHGWEVEVPFTLGDPHFIQSDADLVHRGLYGEGEVGDIKTVPQKTFTWQTQVAKSARFKDVMQVGVAMKALGCGSGRIIYLARDRNPQGDWVAEYTFTWPEVEAWVEYILKGIVRTREMIADGELPPRFHPGDMPTGARIHTISKHESGWSHWATNSEDCESGRTKGCNLCDFKDECSESLSNESELTDE